MRPYSSLGLTTYRPHRDDLMQAIREHRFAASQYLAAEDWHRGITGEAERTQLLRRAGCRPPGIAAALVAGRQAIGSALIWLGARLAATAPARDSVPAVGGSEPRR
jgi:hypothetical protein